MALTVAEYAAAKQLPVDFLTEVCRLRDVQHRFQGVDEDMVYIPHFDAIGLIAIQYRRKLHDDEDDRPRFLWHPPRVMNDREVRGPALYGLWRLPQFRERRDALIFVEGPSDCHTLWLYDEPAIGVPAATSWKPEWAGLVAGFTHYYAVQEPGGSGVQFIAALVESFPDLRIITIPETWDDEDSA